MVIPPHVPGARSYPTRNFGVRFGGLQPRPPQPYRPKDFYKNPSPPLFLMPQPPPHRGNANLRQPQQRQQRVGSPIRRQQRPGPPTRRPNPPFQWKGIISRPPVTQKPRIPPRFQQNLNPRNFIGVRPPRGGFAGRRGQFQASLRPRNANYHSFPAINRRKNVSIAEVKTESPPKKPDEEMIKKVKAAILKCVTARQNLGIPPDCLRAAYVKSEGSEIPLDEIGYKSLFQLIQDIPSIKRLKNSDGHGILVAERYAAKRTMITQIIQATKISEKEGGKALSPMSRRLRKIRHLKITRVPKKTQLAEKKAKKSITAASVPKKVVKTVSDFSPKVVKVKTNNRATLTNRAPIVNAKLNIMQPRSVKYVARKCT